MFSLPAKYISILFGVMFLSSRCVFGQTNVVPDVVHVDPFLINYDVYVEKDRSKVSTGKDERKVISQRYVDYIFDNFRRVNVSQLQDLYSTEESGNRILELDIEYDSGKMKHSRIIGEEHPDELKLALLPIIYAGDFINHKEYWSGIVK